MIRELVADGGNVHGGHRAVEVGPGGTGRIGGGRNPLGWHPQPGLARRDEDRVLLQLSEREVVGDLAEDLRQRSLKRGADRR